MSLINFVQIENSMDKKGSYRISFDDSKGYLVVAYKKEHKCIICENLSRSGNSCSPVKDNNFICADCIESFAYQYSKSAKAISFSKFIKNKIAWKQKLDKAPDIKCRLCGAIIKLPKWKGHLKYCHKVDESPEFKEFFVKHNIDASTLQKKWYNPGFSNLHSVPCGTKINGGPEAKVIFNATFSNRKKF